MNLKKLLGWLSGCLLAGAVVYASDEISSQINISIHKNQLRASVAPDRASLTMLGNNMSDFTQTFTPGSTDQVAIAASVLTNGTFAYVALFTNQWDVNTNSINNAVDIGGMVGSDFQAVMRVRASDVGCGSLHPTNKIYGTSVAGTNMVRFIVVEK